MSDVKQAAKRRQYSKDYIQEAVKLSEKNGVAKASEALGLSRGTLYQWRRKLLSPTQPGAGSQPSYDEVVKEKKRLQQEVEWLTDIIAVLKKSTAILAEDQLGRRK